VMAKGDRVGIVGSREARQAFRGWAAGKQ